MIIFFIIQERYFYANLPRRVTLSKNRECSSFYFLVIVLAVIEDYINTIHSSLLKGRGEPGG